MFPARQFEMVLLAITHLLDWSAVTVNKTYLEWHSVQTSVDE